MTTYDVFLDRVIRDGIAAAREDYAAPAQSHKLNGSIAGFEACRGKAPEDLVAAYHAASAETRRLLLLRPDGAVEDYWRARCFELEVEWACNCVSAALASEGLAPLLSWLPTARGVMKAVEILGVAELAR